MSPSQTLVHVSGVVPDEDHDPHQDPDPDHVGEGDHTRKGANGAHQFHHIPAPGLDRTPDPSPEVPAGEDALHLILLAAGNHSVATGAHHTDVHTDVRHHQGDGGPALQDGGELGQVNSLCKKRSNCWLERVTLCPSSHSTQIQRMSVHTLSFGRNKLLSKL